MNIKSYRTLGGERAPDDTLFNRYFPVKTASRFASLPRGGCVILPGGHKVFAPSGGADLSASKRAKDVRLRFLQFLENKKHNRRTEPILGTPMPICKRIQLARRPQTAMLLNRDVAITGGQPSTDLLDISVRSVAPAAEDSDGKVLFHQVVFPSAKKPVPDYTPADLTSPAHSITPNHSRKSSHNIHHPRYHSRPPEDITEEIPSPSPLRGVGIGIGGGSASVSGAGQHHSFIQQASLYSLIGDPTSNHSSSTTLLPLANYGLTQSPYRAPEYPLPRRPIKSSRQISRRHSIEPTLDDTLHTIQTISLTETRQPSRRKLKGKKLKSKPQLEASSKIESPSPKFQNSQLVQYLRTEPPPLRVDLSRGYVTRQPSVILQPRPQSRYARHCSSQKDRGKTNPRKALMILQAR